MRNTNIILIGALFVCLACAGEIKNNARSIDKSESIKWKTKGSERGNFTIDFPEFPNFPEQEIKTRQIIEGKDVEVYALKLNTEEYKHPNLAYSISYSDQFVDSADQDVQLIFDGDRDGLISSLNAEIEFESHIDYKGYPGRRLYFTIDDSNLKMSYKVYYVNGRLYKLMVLTRHGHLQNKMISKFFNSFDYGGTVNEKH